MVLRIGTVLLAAVLVACVLFSFRDSASQPSHFRSPKAAGRKLHGGLTKDSLLLYSDVWLDERNESGHTHLKAIGVRRCSDAPPKGRIVLRRGNGAEISLAAVAEPIESSCPFTFAPACEWSPHRVSFRLPQGTRLGTKDQLLLNGKPLPIAGKIPSTPSASKLKGLAACVPPLYLYADWVQLAQFYYVWTRVLGAEKVFLYATSVSPTVTRFAKGLKRLRIVPWPELPRGKAVDPNWSFYRVGLVGALNDCLLRTAAGSFRYAAMVDLDEYVFPEGEARPLSPFLDALGQQQAASFIFQHAKTVYPKNQQLSPSVRLNDSSLFAPLGRLEFDARLAKDSRTKYVVRPHAALALSVHVSTKHMRGTKRYYVPKEKARLYHLRRYPPKLANGSDVRKLSVLGPLVGSLGAAFVEDASAAFGEETVALGSGASALVSVTRCLSGWKETGCKVPHRMCAELLSQGHFRLFTSDDPTKPRFVVL